MMNSLPRMSGSFFFVLTLISIFDAAPFFSVFETMVAGLPVVIWPYITVADMPIPCCPLDCLSEWNREP